MCLVIKVELLRKEFLLILLYLVQSEIVLNWTQGVCRDLRAVRAENWAFYNAEESLFNCLSCVRRAVHEK